MMQAPLLEAVTQAIADALGQPFTPTDQKPVGGGCINRAEVLSDGRQRFFVKLNSADGLEMFEAEADGLRELSQARTLHIPEPLCTGTAHGQAFLVMEFIDEGRETGEARRLLGQGVAELHRCQAERFGWHRDNTIGATPQPNDWHSDWVTFYGEMRLRFQLDLAARNGFRGQLQEQGNRLIEQLPAFFTDYRPAPSLLHGDLWGGNYTVDSDGRPVLYDPAVYYGDREADIAMTELFGGFGRDFAAAYNDAWPLDAGYRVRKDLYNLYHLLNHANLFGGGYASQSERVIRRLLSEVT